MARRLKDRLNQLGSAPRSGGERPSVSGAGLGEDAGARPGEGQAPEGSVVPPAGATAGLLDGCAAPPMGAVPTVHAAGGALGEGAAPPPAAIRAPGSPGSLEPVADRDAGMPGVVEQTDHGDLRVVRRAVAQDDRHGAVEVGSALEADASELSILALQPELAEVDLRRALYLDTETTGLSGGGGTLAFLTGAAWFEGDTSGSFQDAQLRVEQWLLPRPGQEVPMLHRLAARLREASCVVSYNGKSFDWPLLRTRFILNRVPAPPLPPHLDLLHCARRVFKRRMGSVRLVEMEAQVLGFERVGDIPGALIPQTYFDVLRGRQPASVLGPVVEHNALDLIALAALMGEMSRRFRAQGEGWDARDRLGLAEVSARAGEERRAASLAALAADDAVDPALHGSLSAQAMWLAGRLAKRRGDAGAAHESWTRGLQTGHPDALLASQLHLALAKLCEHQLGRLQEALTHAAHSGLAEGDEASLHRRARLERKRSARSPV